MTGKYKTILIYCILILLAAALVTYGAFINSKKVFSPEEDYAQKLTELEADLIKAAQAGPGQNKSANTNPTSTRNSHKTRRK
jgi:uncharacterized protein YpmB